MHVPQATRSALVAPGREARALRTKASRVHRLAFVAVEPQMDTAGTDAAQGPIVEVETGEFPLFDGMPCQVRIRSIGRKLDSALSASASGP